MPGFRGWARTQVLELARAVAAVIGLKGQIKLDPTHPDGAPRKLLDVSRITAMGWQARTRRHEGLHKIYDFFAAAPGLRNPDPAAISLVRRQTGFPGKIDGCRGLLHLMSR